MRQGSLCHSDLVLERTYCQYFSKIIGSHLFKFSKPPEKGTRCPGILVCNALVTLQQCFGKAAGGI